jgi:hypothetical protein
VKLGRGGLRMIALVPTKESPPNSARVESIGHPSVVGLPSVGNPQYADEYGHSTRTSYWPSAGMAFESTEGWCERRRLGREAVLLKNRIRDAAPWPNFDSLLSRPGTHCLRVGTVRYTTTT